MKFLAFSNAHSLAHVSRVLEVSKELRKRGHEIIFAGHGKYLKVAEAEVFETRELPYFSLEVLNMATTANNGHLLFPMAKVKKYIQAEVELIQEIRPNILIADNRVTATTSAEICKLPIVNIVNAHMSIHKSIPFFSVRNSMGGRPNFLIKRLDWLINKIECFFFHRVVLRDLSSYRREIGLDSKYSYSYEEGDLTLLADIPDFSPVTHLLDNIYYTGPLSWKNKLPPPKALNSLDPKKKTIYLTIGSLGYKGLIDEVQNLDNKKYQFVIATGKELDSSPYQVPDNVFIEQFVNVDQLLPVCDLVICHGGNGTIYQALSHGVPVLGIANHEEQFYGLKRLMQLKIGKGYRKSQIEKGGAKFLAKAIEEALNNADYRINAIRFQKIIGNWGSSTTKAANLIENFISDKNIGVELEQSVAVGGDR